MWVVGAEHGGPDSGGRVPDAIVSDDVPGPGCSTEGGRAFQTVASGNDDRNHGPRSSDDGGRTSVEDVVARTSEFWYEVTMVLQRMKNSKVRNDFLGEKLLKSNDLQQTLTQIDAIHDVFMPAWSGSHATRKSNAKRAGFHFKQLICESDELFEIPSDYGDLAKYKYATWFEALNKLIACPYWDIKSDDVKVATKSGAIFDDIEINPEKRSHSDNVKFESSRYDEGSKGFSKEVKLGNLQRKVRRRDRRVCRSPGSDDESFGSGKSCSEGRRRTAVEPPARFEEIELTDSSSDSVNETEYSSDEERLVSRGSKYLQRDAVAPELFNMEGKVSLGIFLRDFERYFSHKFAGNQRDRCRELGRFLEGEVRDAYEAVGGPTLKYDRMKKELLRWHKSQQVGRTYKRKAELSRAGMKESETFKLYCMRLEELAHRAYPNDKVEGARKLRKQLLATVPSWFARCVEKRAETKKVIDPYAKITWADIVCVAETEDKKKKRRELVKEEPEVVQTPQHVVKIDVAQSSVKSAPILQQSPSPSLIRESHPPSQQSTTATSDRNLQCHFCGQTGHQESTCFMKKNLSCYACGGVGHGYRDCPQTLGQRSGFAPKCSICSGSHLGKDCSEMSGIVGTGSSSRGIGAQRLQGAIPRAFNPRGGRRDQGSSYRGRPTNYRGQNYRPNYREENASSRNTDAAGISDDVRRESGIIGPGN